MSGALLKTGLYSRSEAVAQIRENDSYESLLMAPYQTLTCAAPMSAFRGRADMLFATKYELVLNLKTAKAAFGVV